MQLRELLPQNSIASGQPTSEVAIVTRLPELRLPLHKLIEIEFPDVSVLSSDELYTTNNSTPAESVISQEEVSHVSIPFR